MGYQCALFISQRENNKKALKLHRMQGNCFNPATAVFIKRGEYCSAVSRENCTENNAKFLNDIIDGRLQFRSFLWNG